VRPLLEDAQPRVQQLRLVGRHLQHVDGLVLARVGVDLGPELHADRLEVAHQRLAREVLGAVERHVFDEVGQPLLVVVLVHRACAHHQPQRGALFRFGVGAHVVAQTVGQGARGHGRVDGQGGRQVRGKQVGGKQVGGYAQDG